MNFRNLLTAALALTTLAAGFFAWRQYNRANELEALAKAAANKQRDDARRRPSEARAQPDAEAGARETDAARPEGDRRGGRGEWQSRVADFRALRDSPEFAKILTTQQKAMLDGRYAPLFKSLNLTPDQLAKLKDLLVEKQNAGRDVMSVAREQGLDYRNNRDEIRQLIQQSNADLDANIASLIGQDKFAQYQSFDQTQPQRAITSQLEQRLSYTAEPLTASQSEQLISLLSQNTPPPPDDGGGNRMFATSFAAPGAPPMGGVLFTAGVPITDQVINEAQSFLSASQVGALRQMQSEQSDQKILQELMRSGGASGGGRSSRGESRGSR